MKWQLYIVEVFVAVEDEVDVVAVGHCRGIGSGRG